MLFALGYIAGIVTAALVFVILAFFKKPIQERLEIVGRMIEEAGPRQKGGIYIPRDDADIVRDEVIASNRKQGKDTPISELI